MALFAIVIAASIFTPGYGQADHGSYTLFDFENDRQFDWLQPRDFATITPVVENPGNGARSARIVFSAVPSGDRVFPAVIVENGGLTLRDFSPYEAVSMRVMNTGDRDAEFSIVLWDANGNRSFPVPSTFTVEPGPWRSVVAKLVMHGIDAKNIASLHFFQKRNSHPCVLTIDDVQLLSPQAGRMAAKVQLARQNLKRARNVANSLGTDQIEQRINALEKRLVRLQESSGSAQQGTDRTEQLLELAQIASASRELTGSANVSMQGRRVTFVGPQPQAGWLSNQKLVKGLTIVRLFNTAIGDDVFARLEAADQLVNFIASGRNITGAGVERLTSDKLRVLFLSATNANDEALQHVGKFQGLESVRLNDTNVTSGVLKYLSSLKRLRLLRLDDTGISDTGFSAVANINTLESLTLRRTKITGKSLQHLKGLKKLKTLDVRDTKIDDAGLAFLGSLVGLESLQLANTPITGSSFEKLRSLDNLSHLNANGTRVGDSALRQLGSTPKLERLEVSSTRITDSSLQHLTQTAKLKYLDAYGTNITDVGVAHLQNQRRLQQLYLGGTPITDGAIAPIEKLNRLTELDLTGTRITDESLKHLKGMKNLVSLRLGSTSISGKGLVHLAGLSKLRVLDLGGTRVNDAGLVAIAKLPNLRRLYLSGTRVTDSGMESLKDSTKLVELIVDATSIGDEGLNSLAMLPNLEVLNLDETQISDKGLRHIDAAKKVSSLSLNRTSITDDGLLHLKNGYSELSLAHTQVTDLGVEHLQDNDQLTRLDLSSTGVTNNAMQLLQAMPNLQRLDLAETNVTDAGLAYLVVLPDLAELNLNGTAISDLGVETLLDHPGLQRLSLENSRVTSQGASWIRQCKPELNLNLVFPWKWGERWSYYSRPQVDERDGQANNSSDNLIQELRALTNLGYLRVDDSLLNPDVLRSLKDLTSLEHLSFEGTSVTDEMLKDLLGLSQIAKLDLSQTAITDAGLEHLKDMQGLRELTLAESEVTGKGFLHLTNLSQLQELNMRQTPLDSDYLEHLSEFPQLRKLVLSGTPTTDDGLAHVSKLTKLQYLDLFGTQITDQGMKSLVNMPTLRYCYLSKTQITDDGVSQLGALVDLEELGLDGTRLSDRGMVVVRSLTNLRRLRIGQTNVTESGLAVVASLPKLKQLELNDLRVSDQGLHALRSLSKLESLDLSGTRVTDQCLSTLSEFPDLRELNVQDTTVTQQGIDRFTREQADINVEFGSTRKRPTIWSACLTSIYVVVVITICFYGLHRHWLVWLFYKEKQTRSAPRPQNEFRDLPKITVQLPMFNEQFVAERIIQAAAKLDYPADRLQIQVLDDSTDDSAHIAEDCCKQVAADGVNIEYLHRTNRDGFKGGALGRGLKTATGEFIAIFDADFVPEPDIIQKMIHHFTDSRIGMVQAEWSHLNRKESWLTECQAIFLDGHFVVEQSVRSHSGRWFNFNGTAGIWRKTCIEEAGGWEHDTLTEDTDLSYRAQLAGWKFLYLPTVHCAAEIPGTVSAFMGQQHRWTKGLLQTAKKVLPRILSSSAPWRVKLEAWYHLTCPLMYLVMFVLTAIALPALFVETSLAHRQSLSFSLALGTLWLGTCGAAGFYLISQRAQGFSSIRTLFKLPLVMALGIGICVVNARAVLEALFGVNSPFVRTPKFGGRVECMPKPSGSTRRWAIPTGLIELILGGVLVGCLVLSFLRPYTLIGAPFLFLFALGYAGIGWLGLRERFDRNRGLRAAISNESPLESTDTRGPSWMLSPARFAIGLFSLLLVTSVAASMVVMSIPSQNWNRSGRGETSFGVDLTTGDWKIIGSENANNTSAIKRVSSERGSLVLAVQLDEQHDEGEIVLDLDGAMYDLGQTLGTSRITFELEYPARFTGELQVFGKDVENRSQYGSLKMIESHDVRRGAVVTLSPSRRMPAMGYQDVGFDPRQGIRRIGLKISAQSDRVRGADYRPFRGSITVTKIRVTGIGFQSDNEPEMRELDPKRLKPLEILTAPEFVTASGFDRPWPLGYGFSGPLAEKHEAELERTYRAIADAGCSFTRVYVGDYRTGVLLDGEGNVRGVEPAFLEYLDRLAAIANRHGVIVMFSLTDNTMADGKGIENVAFMVNGKPSELFIQNGLSPIVAKLKGRQVIWDIFNEPENVTEIPLRVIQDYVDRVIFACRKADPNARFTVVSRSRPEIVYWQGRGLDLYSHNVFTNRSLEESLTAEPKLDAPLMIAEMAPELANAKNLNALRRKGYSAMGIWGWDTNDKYAWTAEDLRRVAAPLIGMK